MALQGIDGDVVARLLQLLEALHEHEGLLHMANRDAAALLQRDPKLTSERGRAVRVLLRLFEKAAAMRTLAAG